MLFKQSHVPVVIIGAGPTGVMLAIELARRGIEVRVVDKQSARSPETRAIGIHARTLEVFHQVGIVEEFLALGHRVDGMTVHTRARRRTCVNFGRLDSPYPFVLMLGQDQTQRILDQQLERLGVAIERGIEVLDLEQSGDGVELTARSAGESDEQTLTADWVVGCDGAHSIVRRRLGVPFTGDDYGQDWLMSEVTIHPPIECDRFHVFSYTDTPMVAFPLPAGRWRLFLPQVPNRAGERHAPRMDEIERLAAARGPAGLKLTNPTLLAAFRCYRRSTNMMRDRRVLVAGDAAHIHSPAGGQGMNTGLHDAFNLGWKLALVAAGQSSTQLLDTYQDERLPIAAGVLALTHDLVRIFTISSPRKRWLRDHLLPIAMAVPVAERGYTRRLSQISHTYRSGPLSLPTTRRRVGSGSIAPGDRLPSVPGLERNGEPVCTLDLISSPAHTLLVLTGDRADPQTAELAVARLARYNGLVNTVTVTGPSKQHSLNVIADPNLAAHRRYQARKGQLLLIRPDGYLAKRAPLNRPDIPARYLLRLTHGAAEESPTQREPHPANS
jgi:2-polyprenyl-6-methoxyphenol hydroxylase-like FAD-dependent oxidoreductase